MTQRFDFWILVATLIGLLIGYLVARALLIGYLVARAQDVDVQPETGADVAGVDLSRDTDETNTATTETHIKAAEGSDVTTVSFTFAGLSGGAAVLVAILYVLGRLLLTNKGQRIALNRLVEAIENASVPLPDEGSAERSWRDGGESTRKGIKRLVRSRGGDDGEWGPRDRAARIIEKHLVKIRD